MKITDTDYLTKINQEHYANDPFKTKELTQFRKERPHIELKTPEMKIKITQINRTISVLRAEINEASNKITDLLKERLTLQKEIKYNKEILQLGDIQTTK